MPASSPGEQVDHLGLEAGALRPAQVHAHEHLRPVLRLGAARSRVDGDDRVLRVLGPREDDLELEGLELFREALETLLDLGGEALVAGLGGHLPEQAWSPPRGRRSSLEGVDACGPARRAPARAPCALRVSSQKLGRGHLGVDQAEAGLLGGEVKDAPGGRRGAAPASATSRLSSPSMTRVTSGRGRGRAPPRPAPRTRRPASRRSACRAWRARRSGSGRSSTPRSKQRQRRARCARSGSTKAETPGVGRARDGHAVLDRAERQHRPGAARARSSPRTTRRW